MTSASNVAILITFHANEKIDKINSINNSFKATSYMEKMCLDLQLIVGIDF